MSPYKVHQFFSNLKEVEIASFITGFGFIRFFDDEFGAELLTESEIEIESQIIQIKPADRNHVPYYMWKHIRSSTSPFYIRKLFFQLEFEASPGNILTALNDNCLCEILARLSFLDLLSVSKTCERLNGIAKKVFKAKHKHIVLKGISENGATMEYLFKNFGSSIESIHLKNYYFVIKFDIVGLIDKHCTNIKSLEFCAFLIDKFTNFTTLLGRLEKLHLQQVSLVNNVWLNACSQLRVLDLLCVKYVNLKHLSLPHLVEINIKYCGPVAGMEEFLIRHPHVGLRGMDWPNSDKQFIFDHLPKIREIYIFQMSNDKISVLREMKNLKSLSLVFGMTSFERVMKELSLKNIPIETLELDEGLINDNAIKYICEMKTITEINFFRCIGFDENILTRLVQYLPNLKLIRCWWSDEFNLNLDEILPILKRRRIEWSNYTVNDVRVTFVR